MVQRVGRLKSRRCSFCRSGGQLRSDVGEVVVGAARFGLERPRRPHAGKRPAVELGGRRDDHRLRRRHRHDRLPLQELLELLQLRLRGGDERARLGMLLLGLPPRFQRIGVPFSREATFRNSSCTSCSWRRAMVSSRSALSEIPSSSFSFCSKRSRPSRNDALARGARSVSR